MPKTPARRQAETANANLPDYPIWKTKAFIGSVVALFAFFAQRYGWIDWMLPEDQDLLADVIVLALGGGGSLTVLLGRWRQKVAPPVKAL